MSWLEESYKIGSIKPLSFENFVVRLELYHDMPWAAGMCINMT